MKKKVNSAAIRWVPVFLWAAIIFVLSSTEQIATSRVFAWDFFIKKFAHVSEYAVLFGLIYRANHGNWISAYVLTIIYAATDEYHQSFVPGRTATYLDLGIDFSGANIAAYCLWKLKQTHTKKPKK